ncbi:MAG: hypothetical protein HKM04_05730 [Legionellales bacterium]|nr:hypothetical protein [Legionellales bacterium]
MKTELFTYTAKQGWSAETFPDLDSESTLILIFGSSKLGTNLEVFQTLLKAYPTSLFLGCSTSGEIFQDSVIDDSLVVAVTKFEKTKLRVVSLPIPETEDSFKVGEKIVDSLSENKLKHIFLLSDGLHVNGTELLNGIKNRGELVGGNVSVSGGLAGDGTKFSSTWVFSRKDLITDRQVVAVGFYGDDFNVQCGSQGGWDTFGPERTITKAYKNILYEIDGQPALELYKRYLGARADELPASALLYPLAIRKDINDSNRIVRTILSVNEADQSMTFAGDIPENWRAQLMTANFERLIDGASTAGKSISSKHQQEVFSIAISCVGRRLVLGERTEEEVEAVLEMLPENTKQIGFYSYGEISPVQFSNCELHNQTMTLTVLTEN